MKTEYCKRNYLNYHLQTTLNTTHLPYDISLVFKNKIRAVEDDLDWKRELNFDRVTSLYQVI